MNNDYSLNAHLHFPVLRAEADAHRLDRRLCQLIIHATDESEGSLRLLASLLAELFLDTETVYLIVLGPFERAKTTSNVLHSAPCTTAGGMKVFEVSGIASIATKILRIDAEELALFVCSPTHLHEYIRRVEQLEGTWWKPSTTTLRGALTKVTDLVDHVVFYSSSHHSIEVLGERSAVMRFVDIVWRFV